MFVGDLAAFLAGAYESSTGFDVFVAAAGCAASTKGGCTPVAAPVAAFTAVITVHGALVSGTASTHLWEKLSSFMARGGESDLAARGRQAHKDYPKRLGPGYEYEKTIKKGKGGFRVDAIDFINRIVRELKPNNPRAIARGLKQVERYRKHLEKVTGKKWTGKVDTY